MTSSSPNYKDTTAAIIQLFDLWYNEFVDGNMAQINKLSTITAANGYIIFSSRRMMYASDKIQLNVFAENPLVILLKL